MSEPERSFQRQLALTHECGQGETEPQSPPWSKFVQSWTSAGPPSPSRGAAAFAHAVLLPQRGPGDMPGSPAPDGGHLQKTLTLSFVLGCRDSREDAGWSVEDGVIGSSPGGPSDLWPPLNAAVNPGRPMTRPGSPPWRTQSPSLRNEQRRCQGSRRQETQPSSEKRP